MTVLFCGRTYAFRVCDTENFTQEELQRKVDEIGYIQYEIRSKWLVVPGVGFGWEVS